MGLKGKTIASELLFKEEQRFTQWYIRLFLIGLLALPVYGIIQQIILDEPFGNNPMSDWGLIFFFIGISGFCYYFLMLCMKTVVTRDYLYIHFPPMVNKKIPWKDIQQIKMVKYSTWIGYGLRFSSSYGTVYNVKGNTGMQLLLKNGKKYMIGTQRSRELEEIARSVLKSM